MKKIVLTILIFILILGGSGIWYFFFNGKDTLVGEALRDVLPFGNGGSDVTTTADEDKPVEISPVSNNQNIPKLFRLSETPVAGAVSLIKNGSEIVRFVDRATGHIYDINPVTLEKTKIANNTQPKIYEAYFRKDGNGVIMRSLKNDSDEVSNLSIELIPPKSTSTTALYTEITSILRGNITSIAISDTGKLVYADKDAQGVIMSDFTGNNPRTLYSSAFNDWLVSWSGEVVTLTTKASSAADGFSYSLSLKGNLSKLLGPINGLTVNRSPDGKKAIYSSSADGKIRSFVQNTITGQNFEVLPSLLPEKCVWSKKNPNIVYCGTSENFEVGGEPDLWYQGITHLNDNLWKFDMENGSADLVVEPRKTYEVQMDIINPFITPDEDYLVFMNKNDLSLWALKLTE